MHAGEWLSVLALSWALFGLIWTVQLVHYPSFHFVPDFSAFHPHHTRSISFVVAPLMVTELGLAIWLVFRTGGEWVWVVALALVIVIWIITFFRAIPLHDALSIARDPEGIDALIRVNWLRTLLWSVKSLWVSYLFLTDYATLME